jgi:hypothetical protein
VISHQFVLEFVNVALHSRSAIVNTGGLPARKNRGSKTCFGLASLPQRFDPTPNEKAAIIADSRRRWRGSIRYLRAKPSARAAIIQLCGPAVGVASDALSGFQSVFVFRKIRDTGRPKQVR